MAKRPGSGAPKMGTAEGKSAMRMTEEEFAAFQARRRAPAVCCQPARPSGVTLDLMADEQTRGKAPKYRNQRAEVNGLKFDSKHEARVYEELMLRVRAGELKAVVRQVGFDLPGGIRYFADFVVIDHENRITVYDAKSEITRKNRVYINKKKQMKACWDIEIKEV